MKKFIIILSLLYNSTIFGSSQSIAQAQKKYSLQKRVDYPENGLGCSVLKVRIKNHLDGH